MRVTKDIYEYLTRFVDDKTIISMFSVNKKFNSEDFYTRVLRRKYPLLLTFKCKTMKSLYVHMTYYISKLETEFDIPYIPSTWISPRHIYKRYREKDIKSFAMCVATREGHMDLVKVMSDKGATDVNWSLRMAAHSGHLNIVKFMLDLGATHIDEATCTAVTHKHIDIVEFLSEKGADVNKALTTAFRKEDRDMIDFLISCGANDFRQGGIHAASKGNIELVKLCIERGVDMRYLISCVEKGYMEIVQLILNNGYTDFNRLLSIAALKGQSEIIQLMLDLGATEYNKAMRYASQNGHKDIVQMMLDLGATEYNKAMTKAASGGHKDIVQMMLDLGATNYNKSMIRAVWGGYKDIVQMMLDLDARNYNESMVIAAGRGDKDIVQMMLNSGAKNYNESMENAVAKKNHMLNTKYNIDLQDVIELLNQYV